MKKASLEIKLEKIIAYGLYFLVFLLPIQTRWIIRPGEINGGYSEYRTISLYGIDILLFILVSLFVAKKIKDYYSQKADLSESAKFKIKTYWWLIAGLELFVFISVWVAPDKLIAVYGYLRLLAGLGLFWLIVGADYCRLKMAYFFLAGIFCQAGLGIWQFLSQSDFAFKWLGLAKHDPAAPGVSVVETLSGQRWLRAYGGLDHPNMLGGLLAIGLLILFLYIIKEGYGKKTDSQKIFYNYKILLFYFLAAVFFVGLFFSFSRAAWVALAAGFALILIAALIKKDLGSLKKIITALLLLGSVGFFLIAGYGEFAAARAGDKGRLEKISHTERRDSLQNAWPIIKDNLSFGVGINNYSIKLSQTIKNNSAYYSQPVHNVYLLVLAEIGLVGFIFFIAFLIFTFWRLLLKIKEKNSGIYYLALFLSLLILFLFDHWWWSLHFGVLFFWLLMGIIYRENNLS